MNKKTIILNIILVLGVVFSVFAFAVFMDTVIRNWDIYNSYVGKLFGNEMDEIYSVCLKQTFAEIFIGLTAIILIASLLIVDIPLIKSKLQARNEKKN